LTPTEPFVYAPAMKITAYPSKVETQMCDFYNSLSETDRRRYAALEASKLGDAGTIRTQNFWAKGPPRNKWSILVEAIPGGCPDVRN